MLRNGSGSGNGNGVWKRQRLAGTAKRQRKNSDGMVETGHQSAAAVSLQHTLRPAVHILNKVFESNIALTACFSAVDNSSSYTS